MAKKWDDLERWMEGQQLPKGFELLREPDWVETFVKRVMTNALPEAAERMTSSSSEVTETKQYVHLKMKLPLQTDYSEVRLKVREDRIQVEGLPGGKRKVVKLPALVKPRVCQASIRDNQLRVKLRKRPLLRKMYDHYIQW